MYKKQEKSITDNMRERLSTWELFQVSIKQNIKAKKKAYALTLMTLVTNTHIVKCELSENCVCTFLRAHGCWCCFFFVIYSEMSKKKLLSKFYDAMCLIFDSIEAHAHIKVPYYLISCIRTVRHIKNDENISLT